LPARGHNPVDRPCRAAYARSSITAPSREARP
jgi:hypothetical protein